MQKVGHDRSAYLELAMVSGDICMSKCMKSCAFNSAVHLMSIIHNKDVYLGFEVERCAQVPKLARAQLKMGSESGVFPQYTGFILHSSEKGRQGGRHWYNGTG